MAQIELKNLINSDRFKSNETTLFFLILYLPLGITLFLLRGLLYGILMILNQILPKNSPAIDTFLNNIVCLCFGIVVTVDNQTEKENSSYFLSNYVSIFDQAAIFKAIGNLMVLNKLPLKLEHIRNVQDFGAVADDKNHLEKLSKEHKRPILLFPEDHPTNGSGLLKFNNKYFDLFDTIQPICLSINRFGLDISVSALQSALWSDILFFMFCPFTWYKIKYLPLMERKNCSTDEEFADVIRGKIATELSVEATNFAATDLIEWSKKQFTVIQRRNIVPNPELARMASQVREVFPNIPASVIYNDLVITRNVDRTISNILEGRIRVVQAVSRTLPTQTAGASSASAGETGTNSSTNSPPPITSISSSFGRTGPERAQSFQERKNFMILAARKRYIEKHQLKIAI